MKVYTAHHSVGATLINVATDQVARGKFLMFLAESSQRGWDLLQVNDVNGGMLFVFQREPNVAPAPGIPPPAPPPLPPFPN